MSFLDTLLLTRIQDNGVDLEKRGKLNLVGFTIVDDPTNGRTTVTGGGGGGGGSPTGAAGGVLGGTYPNPTMTLTSNASLSGVLPVTKGGTGGTGPLLADVGKALVAISAGVFAMGALNLALAGAVSGILPVANLPDATAVTKGIVQLAGDLGAGTAASPIVVGLTGTAGTVAVHSAGFTIDELAGGGPYGFAIYQSSRTSDAKPQDYNWQAQGSLLAATTYTRGGGYDLFGGTGATTGGIQGPIRFWALGVGSGVDLSLVLEERGAIFPTPVRATEFVLGTVTSYTGPVVPNDPSTVVNLSANAPTISTGTGVPATTKPNGSLFLRTDGAASTGIYTRQAGAWSAVGGTTSVTMGGDVTGNSATSVVTQARGLMSATTTVSVSAATAPTSGQVLTATSGTAATWQTPASGGAPYPSGTGIVRVSGGAAWGTTGNVSLTTEVTGVLPEANQADQTMGGNDVSGLTSTAVVYNVTGASNKLTLAATARSIEWAAATTTPGISQATNATANATAATMSFTAQGSSGTGTTTTGALAFSTGVSTLATIGNIGNMTFTTPVPVGAGTYGNFQFNAGGQLLTIEKYPGLSGHRIVSSGTYFTLVGAQVSISASVAASIQSPTFTIGNAGVLGLVVDVSSNTQTWLAYAATTSLKFGFTDSATAAGTGAELRIYAQNATGTGATVGGLVDIRGGTGATAGAVKLSSGATEKLRIEPGGVSINGAGSYGGGVGVLSIKAASTMPTTNPTAASVLYGDTTTYAVMARATTGVVTQLNYT